MLWGAASARGEVARGAGGIEEFSGFAFGLPSALPIGDGRLLAVPWVPRGTTEPRATVLDRYGVLWTTLQLSGWL